MRTISQELVNINSILRPLQPRYKHFNVIAVTHHIHTSMIAIQRFHPNPFPNSYFLAVDLLKLSKIWSTSSFVSHGSQMPPKKASSWFNRVLHPMYETNANFSASLLFCALTLSNYESWQPNASFFLFLFL